MGSLSDLAGLATPRHVLTLGGLLLCLAVVWAAAFLLRDILAGLLLRQGGGPRPGDRLNADRHSGVVSDLGWRQVVLRTAAGGTLRVPNSYLLRHPYEVLAPRDGQPEAVPDTPVTVVQAPPTGGEEPPPVADTASLIELQQAHAATLAAIAALADEPRAAGEDASIARRTSRDRQQQLIRQLARIETLIAERRRQEG